MHFALFFKRKTLIELKQIYYTILFSHFLIFESLQKKKLKTWVIVQWRRADQYAMDITQSRTHKKIFIHSRKFNHFFWDNNALLGAIMNI